VPRPRKSLDDQLAELTRKRDQLEARRQALVASKKSADRKLDARRKIIVGAAVMAHAELNPSFADQLRAILNAAVTRAIDRNVIPDLLSAPVDQVEAAA
jgi:hypothetical protein